MAEIDTSEAPERVYAAPSATDQWLRPSLTVDQIEADDVVYVRADLLATAEAERDKALAQVAALTEVGSMVVIAANSDDPRVYACWEHLERTLRDTAAAAREYRASVVEECADIAAAATITDHDNLSWTDGRRVAVEAIRAHAAKVREGWG